MAMCVMAVVGAAPCQCFSPGENQTTSLAESPRSDLPSAVPEQPAVTMRVCPSGCVCHAVRAPGSNVTLATSFYSRHLCNSQCAPLQSCHLAIDQFLQVLGIPSSLHRNLRSRAVDLAEIVGS